MHVFPFDLVHVVQRRIRHRYTTDEHRFESGDRRERTRSTDLKFDLTQHSERFVRRKFMGDRPARCARHEAEIALRVEIVDFIDDTVDLIRQPRAARTDVSVVIEAALDALHDTRLRTDAQAPIAKLLQYLAVPRRQGDALDDADRIGEQLEWTRRRHARVELPQATGRSIAWIDEYFVPSRCRFGVHALETGDGHEHFAAHLEQFRRPTTQPQRQGGDGTNVSRDVFTGRTVTSSRRPHQNTVFEGHGDRKAIELRLGRIGEFAFGSEALPRASIEVQNVLVGERVVEREHRDAMPHLGKFFGRRGSDALRR